MFRLLPQSYSSTLHRAKDIKTSDYSLGPYNKSCSTEISVYDIYAYYIYILGFINLSLHKLNFIILPFQLLSSF